MGPGGRRGCDRHRAGRGGAGAARPVPHGAGLLLALLGAGLLTLASGRDGATDRDGVTLVGWFVVGWGLTALLSGWLGRRRAAALRRAPVPVLRVLVRDGADGDAEVFAADDVEARRPLFTVAAEEWYDDGEEESEEDDASEGAAERDERDELLDAIEFADDDDGQPGPLREAVLYGPPHEGAEIVIVSAAERPDAPEEPDAPEHWTGPRGRTGPRGSRTCGSRRSGTARTRPGAGRRRNSSSSRPAARCAPCPPAPCGAGAPRSGPGPGGARSTRSCGPPPPPGAGSGWATSRYPYDAGGRVGPTGPPLS